MTKDHQNHDQKNNKKGVIGEQLTDKEIESNAGSDVAHNMDSGLGKNQEGKQNLIEELKESNIAMKREIEKLTKIAGTSQVQYLSLKNEFDAYIARIDGEKKEIKLSELKKIVSKFSKLLEQIRLFLSHLDKNLVDNEQIKGLQLIYESFLAQELSQMGIFQIQSLGFTPDTDLHEILMVKPVTQETLDQLLEREIKLDGEKEIYSLEELNGHIIEEFEVGYYYFDGEKKIIIKPSKVAVGS